MTETKEIEVQGKKFVIRRLTVKENFEVNEAKTANERFKLWLHHGTEPKIPLDKIDDMDALLAEELSWEIQDFNLPPFETLQKRLKRLEEAQSLGILPQLKGTS